MQINLLITMIIYTISHAHIHRQVRMTVLFHLSRLTLTVLRRRQSSPTPWCRSLRFFTCLVRCPRNFLFFQRQDVPPLGVFLSDHRSTRRTCISPWLSPGQESLSRHDPFTALFSLSGFHLVRSPPCGTAAFSHDLYSRHISGFPCMCDIYICTG